MFVPIPNRYYERVRGWAPATLGTIADTYLFKSITENVRQVDQFGGYTAGAGHALYTARTFPPQWWNKTAFVCEPTGHLVGTFVLQRTGADYRSTSPINLLASDDEWCAPIMAEVGPDGAVWVIDWYNYIVQHNPTPNGFENGKGNAYESELRDKKHGRIYRVVPIKNEPGVKEITHESPSLANATSQQLIEALKHPAFVWRLTAQRLLTERFADQPAEILSPLIKLLQDDSVDAIGLNVGAIHALQTLKAVGALNTNVSNTISEQVTPGIDHALGSKSAGVRRNALAVLPASPMGAALLKSHPELFTDSDAQVQLQAFLTLSDIPLTGSDLAAPIFTVASTTRDRVLLDALTSAASVHATTSLSRFSQGNQKANSSATCLQIARRVAEHIGRGKPGPEILEAVIIDLQKAAPDLADAILDGVIAGIPANFEFKATQSFDAALLASLNTMSAAGQSKLVRLAAQCGTKALDDHAEKIVQSMKVIVADKTAGNEERLNAAKYLIGFRPDDADVVRAIVAQVTSQTPPELAVGLLQTVQSSKSVAVGDAVVQSIGVLTPQTKSAAISTLLSRPDWAKALLVALEKRDIELTDMSLDQKQSLQSFPDPSIRQQAQKLLAMSGGLPDADRDRVLKSLLHIAEHEGDVKAGFEMFKKHCSKCHIHGETGKNIGPNLTGMAVHPKDELLTHIIDPSRSVEGNFRIYTVVLNDGRVANGMLASETRTSITLIDPEARETSIQREDIEEILASKKSLMPEGFEKQMTESELSNLLQFLTNKGKYVPIPMDRYATAISTKGLFHDGDDGPDRMIFQDWQPKFLNQVPYLLTDPKGKSRPNIILLHGPFGTLPPKMPKSIILPCNTPAKTIHLLGGVGGWNFPFNQSKSVSLIVKLHYADGTNESHELLNGVHMADYISRVDVPGSDFAFMLGGQQLRHINVTPKRSDTINSIELIKGTDNSAPIVMAVTIERNE